MAKIKKSSKPYDQFAVMDCPHCGRLNTFFVLTDVIYVKDPRNKSILQRKRKCDTCGVSFTIAEFDQETKETSRFYRVITDKDVKAKKYLLSPHHSFGDPEGFFDPERIESVLEKQTS